MGVKMCARHARECVVRRVVVGARASWYAAWMRATKPSKNRGLDGYTCVINSFKCHTIRKIRIWCQLSLSQLSLSQLGRRGATTQHDAGDAEQRVRARGACDERYFRHEVDRVQRTTRGRRRRRWERRRASGVVEA